MIDITGAPVSRAEFEQVKAMVHQHQGALLYVLPAPKPPIKDLDILICLAVIVAVSAYVAYRCPEEFSEVS